MFVFDVIGRLSVDRSICILDLEMNRAIFGLCLVSVPSESSPNVWFPPLNPIVGPFTFQVELDPEPGFRRRVLAFQKRDGVDLCHDLVGVSPGRFVPNLLTTASSRETIVDTAKELWLNRAPHAEQWSHDGSPRAFEANIRGDVVSQ